MFLYEAFAARLIGPPLQRPAEWLRHVRGARFRRDHRELAEWFHEGGRADACVRRAVAADTKAIDIGCHIGSLLQTLLTVAPRGRHHAFEPVPQRRIEEAARRTRLPAPRSPVPVPGVQLRRGSARVGDASKRPARTRRGEPIVSTTRGAP
jgi:hypothetical protein